MIPLNGDLVQMLRQKATASLGKTDGSAGMAPEGRENGETTDRPFGRVAAGAFEATLVGDITDANDTLAELLGFASAEELVGSSLAELLADPATLDRVCGHTREGQELTGEEMFLRTKRGDEVVVLLSTKLVGPPGKGGRVIGTLIDITERKRRESDLERLAYEDPLTGVANRRALGEHAENYLALADRRNTHVGLIYLDLTRFKAINDRHGHAAGDAVLVEVARRLEATARTGDVVGRVGGDEFVVVLPDVEDRDAVVTVARRMVTGLEEEPVELEDARTTVRAVAGIAVYHPGHGADLDELIRTADQAMYRGKKSNGDADPPEAEEAGERAGTAVTATGERSSPNRVQH